MAYSYANDSGYSGYVVELGSEVACGQWSEVESQQSLLKVISLALKSFADKLEDHSYCKWLTDNLRAICTWFNDAIKEEHLKDGTMAIFELCFTLSI